MQRSKSRSGLGLLAVVGLILAFGRADAQQAQQAERGQSSYMPVDITEPFASIKARLSAAKPAVEQEHNALLNERYDLSNRPTSGVTMDRVKPVQEGVRVKLPAGITWESLAAMTPDQIRDQNLFPKGFIHCRIPSTRRAALSFRILSSMRSSSRMDAICSGLISISISRIGFCPSFRRRSI